MMVELEDRVSQLESWKDGKGVIVVGAAGTFCSGSDLNAVRAISDPQVEQQGGTLAVSPWFLTLCQSILCFLLRGH